LGEGKVSPSMKWNCLKPTSKIVKHHGAYQPHDRITQTEKKERESREIFSGEYAGEMRFAVSPLPWEGLGLSCQGVERGSRSKKNNLGVPKGGKVPSATLPKKGITRYVWKCKKWGEGRARVRRFTAMPSATDKKTREKGVMSSRGALAMT